MGDSSHKSIFSIEEFPAAERGSAFSGTNPPGFGADPEHKSSPNLRRIKGKEPRHRTESASEASETDNVGELHHFRSRSRSAPSSLMVAARYGRELRRMSDEFDQIFTSIPRPKSASAATEMTVSKSFTETFLNFFRRKNKDRNESENDKH
ncbi:bcl2-associated agonist of cell death isoform X2 [Rana temporaria]|uniref:bcl2-associated agonist of cell death isoform X2 n=1 Tax=Rana temporaria TaxID=8407 RepID=UPI001AAE1577|nr:bcl2-associated agonist of cell death isoform X2 [Rana temporaria]XP_040184947.1 bcl2-associated agonist of cell death isoform X2 [Rana temporaria]